MSNRTAKILNKEQNAIPAILDIIHNNKVFLVSSHINPEGDAIGSALALALGLKSLRKEVFIYFEDPIPPLYHFLPLVGEVARDLQGRRFDATFVVDCAELDRLGEGFKEVRGKGLVINIDHHPTNTLFGDINFIRCDASAAGEIVYELLKAMGVKITLDIAVNLYVAILIDTGSFRYSSTTPDSFRIAAELVGIGVNPWEVAKRIYESHSEKRLRLLGLALETLELYSGDRIALILVTREMLDRAGATPDMTENFVNYPRSIEGVEVALLIREIRDGEYKVSFRAKGEIDVAEIASFFGGGGHYRAAGCNIKGSLEDVKKRVVGVIENTLVRC